MFTKEQQKLYRKVKEGDKYAIAEWNDAKYKKVRHADEEVEKLSLTIQWRNLTINEASLLYECAKIVDGICPLNDSIEILTQLGKEASIENLNKMSSYKNAKRNALRGFTWFHQQCPVCCREVSGQATRWFVRPYYISAGFLKVCRDCYYYFKESHHCIHAYYPHFMHCHDKLGNDVAWSIFLQYLKRGIVFNHCDGSIQAKADSFMEYYQQRMQFSLGKRRKGK